MRTFFILLLAFLLSCHALRGEEYGEYKVVKVTRVVDGDTFVCDIENLPAIIGQNIKVRVAAINTPELKSKDPELREKALKAKEFSENILLSAKKVVLKKTMRCHFFRIVAEVWADDLNLGDELLKSGLADIYVPARKKPVAKSYSGQLEVGLTSATRSP